MTEAATFTSAPMPTSASNLPPATMLIQNVRLEEFEKAVYARDHERASQLLLAALRRLKVGGEFIGYAQTPPLRAHLFTRFCAAVITLLADPGFSLSQDGFDQFASEHAILDVCFRHSAFGSSDHLLALLASNSDEADVSKLKVEDGSAMVKFLLTYSMRSGFDMSFEQSFARGPQAIFGLWAGMLSALLTIDPKAQERHEQLLGLHKLFDDVIVSPAVLPTLSDAYMYTSYALRPDKHDAKTTIHRILARSVARWGVQVPPADKVLGRRKVRHKRERPVVLVCLEWFTGLHAMYRCYAPIIRQLRQRFHLVAMSRASDIDEIGKAEFDEWHEVKSEGLVLAELVAEVHALAPDMIYFPSVGMAMWWVVLASLRLAPIQFMTLGHPASSRSPCMDYVVCEEGAIGDPALFSERIVTMPFGSARYTMRQDAAMPEPQRDASPPVVRVAVPAMLCKLNARFLAALKKIAEGVAARQGKGAGNAPVVEFHFFINMGGVNLHQAAREIRAWLPTALIYERAHYNTYVGHLQRCHLHLATFPFGGTNSNIDSMLLGIPVLALEGREPHERFDAMQLRHAGLGEAFIASTVERYVERAAELIVNHADREAARDHLLVADLRALFFGDPPPGAAGGFLNAVECIFNQHETMQASEHRVFATSPAFPVRMES